MTSSSFIYHSSVLHKLNIKGIFDSNPDKQGKIINNLKISILISIVVKKI